MGYLDDRWREACTPADTREIWEWAHDEGELPPVYAVSGKLDIDTCPMIKAPLRALRNPIVRSVVVMAGVQCLKTLLGELWLLWSIVNDPGPTQWLQPDDQEAKEHAQERFLPLIASFPAVHRFYTPNRFDKQNDFIRFAHCFLRIEGANNKGNLQRKSIKNQMRSEVWQRDKWPPGRLKEAGTRQTQFVHNSKSYTESQPGWDAEYGEDDMHAAWLEGNRNVLMFRCQACGRLQPFAPDFKRADESRAALRWDETDRTRRENGDWRWGELAQTIRWECIHCGERHFDDPLVRRRMTASLEHVPQNPECDPSVESFTWNQFAMPQLPWFDRVKSFLIAHQQARLGQDVPLRDWWMKVAAEPYNPARHSAVGDMETIELNLDAATGEGARAKVITVDGIEFVYRLMGVDVQADHFWLLVEAWSKRGDSLTLHFERVPTWADVRERQIDWLVHDQDVMVDVSHRRHEVITECARHGHVERRGGRNQWTCWKALQGSDQEHFNWTPKTGPNKGKRLQLPFSWPPGVGDPCAGLPANDPKRGEFRGKTCQVIEWSNPTIKDIVIARRDGRAKGCQNLVARGTWNQEFNLQMHSQKKSFVASKYGGGKWKWVKYRADHGLDCKCEVTTRAFQAGLLGGQGSGED